MIGKHKLVLTILILIFAVLVSVGWAKNKIISAFSNSYPEESAQVQKEDLMVEAEKMRKRMFKVGKTKNLNALVALADEIEATWVQKDVMFYASLMVDICGELNSADYDDDRQYLFLRKYTKLALEKADQMPAEFEVRLLGFLSGNIEYVLKLVKEEDWSQDRTGRTKLWCHAWGHLEKEIDENHDVSKEFTRNPNLSNEQNRQAQTRHFYQRRARKIYAEFSESFERYVVFAYSKKPANTSELRYYLESYVQDVQLRERILTKVENNISNAQ